MSEKPVIDERCGMPSCDDRGEYALAAACFNCHSEFVVRMTKGHEASRVECPACGVDRTPDWGGLVDVTA